MKKLILLILFSFLLVAMGISGQNIEKDTKSHEIYIPNMTYVDAIKDAKIIHTGSFDIIRVDETHYDEVRGSIKDIYGESVRYNARYDEVNNIIKKHDVHIVDRDIIDDQIILYGYSDRLGNSIEHNNQKVNIEISYGNNTIQIGTPLIMGSY